ncbi:MAG: hypothetical protein AAGC63_09740 [Propionicimonas sp.]
MPDTCLHGHPRTPENTTIRANGRTRCLPCNRDSVRRSAAQPRPTCTLDYCDRPARNISGGLCTGHLQQIGRGEPLRPLGPRGGSHGGHRQTRKPDTPDCSHPDCTLAGWRKKGGKPWCNNHVPAATPRTPRPPKPQPKVETPLSPAETPAATPAAAPPEASTRLPKGWNNTTPTPRRPTGDKTTREIGPVQPYTDDMQARVDEFTAWLQQTGRHDIAQILGLQDAA